MSVLKKLAGETAVYGLSSVLGRMINFVLVPFYTSELSRFSLGDYGIVTELYAYVAFLNILYVFGLETAYFRFSKKGDTQTFNTAFTSILLTSISLSGALWLFSEVIADTLQYPGKEYLIQWLALILAVDAIVAIPFAKLRQDGEARKFAVFKLTNISVNISLNLFFILFCPWFFDKHPDHVFASIYDPTLGVGYVFLSNLIANGLYFLFFLPLWKNVKLRISPEQWKQMMKYAWPVLIIGFAGVTNEMLSRAILKYHLPVGFYDGYTNQEILGIFGACYKLAVFMTLAIQAFRYAFEPFLFAQAKEKNSPQVFSKVMTYFVLFNSFSWLVLSLFLPYYAPIFLRQSGYLFALNAVPWLLGGGLFLGIFYNLSIWYKLTDNTIYGAIISIIGALGTLVLNWMLIPLFGYMGSAYATLFTYLLMVLISFLWGRKHYPVPYELGKVLTYVGLASLGITANQFFEGSFILAAAIALIFLTLAFLLEKKNLRSINS